MSPHSSTLAWKIPWMEEPGGLQSIGSLRVGHDWATNFHFSLTCIGEGNGNPLQCSCLENPREGGAWWATLYGVAQSRTRLKWLSSSSNSKVLTSSSNFPEYSTVEVNIDLQFGLENIIFKKHKIKPLWLSFSVLQWRTKIYRLVIWLLCWLSPEIWPRF